MPRGRSAIDRTRRRAFERGGPRIDAKGVANTTEVGIFPASALGVNHSPIGYDRFSRAPIVRARFPIFGTT